MRSWQRLFVLSGFGVALAAMPAHAALVTSHLATDADMLAILTQTVVVAEGRIGDRGGAATFELDLGQDTGAPATTAQYNWVSGQVEPFSLSFDTGLNEVVFQLGGKILVYNPGPNLDELFVRVRATRDETSLTVDNMVLDGEFVFDQASTTGPAPGLDILRIEGANLNDGFLLTGDATLNWGAVVPTNSNLAFQIKIGYGDDTVQAESGTWGRMKALYR